MILPITRKSCKHLVVQISRKEMINWHEMIQLHCMAMTLLSNSQNLQKVETDIVIFNGNVLGHAWHTWCKKCTTTNGKRMSCSSLICHLQIFKSIHFINMGLWKWITFILIHTVQCRISAGAIGNHYTLQHQYLAESILQMLIHFTCKFDLYLSYFEICSLLLYLFEKWKVAEIKEM